MKKLWKKALFFVETGILITLLAGCDVTGGSVRLPAQKEVTEKTIRDVFAEHGMKVGTCVSRQVIGQERTEELILSQFNSVTMENAMKPDSILSQSKSKAEGRLAVEFSQETRDILAWAKKNHLAMRGHTMIWYSQTPEWIFHEGFDLSGDLVDREEMLLRMESMIQGIFDNLDHLGYLDLFYAYDVVNEAWMEDGSLRETLWRDVIGDDYLWYAFYYADQYAPESIDLYYNDYNVAFKEETLIPFVEETVDEKGRRLIDGIGLQAHLFTNDDLEEFFDAVDAYAQAGIRLELTEVDVGLGRYQTPLSATEENLKLQGTFYYRLFNELFRRADEGKLQMDAVTFWGFSDAYSWRSEYSPQLYDAYLSPKHALYGIMQIREYAGFEGGES